MTCRGERRSEREKRAEGMWARGEGSASCGVEGIGECGCKGWAGGISFHPLGAT